MPTSPSRNGELVSSSTSHDWATDCIQVPTSETSWPAVNSRKSRFSRARSGPGSREGGRATRRVYAEAVQLVNAACAGARGRPRSLARNAPSPATMVSAEARKPAE